MYFPKNLSALNEGSDARRELYFIRESGNEDARNGESIVTGYRENVWVALVNFHENINALYEGSDASLGLYFIWKNVEGDVRKWWKHWDML